MLSGYTVHMEQGWSVLKESHVRTWDSARGESGILGMLTCMYAIFVAPSLFQICDQLRHFFLVIEFKRSKLYILFSLILIALSKFTFSSSVRILLRSYGCDWPTLSPRIWCEGAAMLLDEHIRAVESIRRSQVQYSPMTLFQKWLWAENGEPELEHSD